MPIIKHHLTKDERKTLLGVSTDVPIEVRATVNYGINSFTNNCGLGSIQSISGFVCAPLVLATDVAALPEKGRLRFVGSWEHDGKGNQMRQLGDFSQDSPIARMMVNKCYESILQAAYAASDMNPSKAGYMLSDNVIRNLVDQDKIKTANFIRWLIKNRHGVVYAMPMAVNPVHRSPGDFSLVQAFYWIPPNALMYNTPDRPIRTRGITRLPGKAKFLEQWQDRMPAEVKQGVGEL